MAGAGVFRREKTLVENAAIAKGPSRIREARAVLAIDN